MDSPKEFHEALIAVLERIARAQEGMLGIAAEARVERLKLANDMKKRMQEMATRPLEEKQP